MHLYTRDQQAAARVVALVPWLQQNYPDRLKMIGRRATWTEHDSIFFGTKGGWIQYSTGEHGNSIDFLVKFLGYSVPDAVLALIDGHTSLQTNQLTQYVKHLNIIASTTYRAPQRANNDKRVIAYLTQRRGIPYDIIRPLLQQGAIYQDVRGNVVFAGKNYAQLRGTGDTLYKGLAPGSKPDGFWSVTYGHGNTVYVVEGGIDALSLRAIQVQIKPETPATYVSMGGVKDIVLQSIQREYPCHEIVLAVDRDAAGDNIAVKYPSFRRIKPAKDYKDWNLQLLAQGR